MRRAQEKGYDKWTDLAQCVWDIVDMAYTLRDDLTIIFVAHTQTERDDSGYRGTDCFTWNILTELSIICESLKLCVFGWVV